MKASKVNGINDRHATIARMLGLQRNCRSGDKFMNGMETQAFTCLMEEKAIGGITAADNKKSFSAG
ncbi:hypothetical protein D3P07_17720 [Paenibacillus sp. 1011MAR3C5]|uniref:hypothetical protein n=1 Tax=Paenibacillus sp. 1011MAR3C5 TaxID=1675787 RepID=UPI000E6B59E4|nr:hypothetical protein [Paenibacillus sp. 1011MAR3C5]RJE87012.1 hypothetical protein D3P07_17720 [Paenibacillus sp. 1011MAR3C5]